MAEDIPLRAFPDNLQRMQEYWREKLPEAEKRGGVEWSRYLSTHPYSEERGRLFSALSDRR